MIFRAALVSAALLFSATLTEARPGGASAMHMVAYGPDPEQVVIVFPAPGPGPHPLVFFTHGGGWVQGDPRSGHLLAPALNAAGYTVISAGYRLVPQTTIEGATEDAAMALAFVLRDPGRFGVAPGRVALAGHSAGATLAALLATDPHYLRTAGLDPARIAAVFTLDGMFDVDADHSHAGDVRRHRVFGDDPAAWARYSPVTYISAMTTRPRFCVAHEDTVPRFAQQAELFAQTLRAHGQMVEVLVVPGATHMEMLQQASNPTYPIAAFIKRCLSVVMGDR